MSRSRISDLTRRSLLRSAADLTGAALLPRQVTANPDFKLIPKPAKVKLVGKPHPDTAVWAYNELTPGPPILTRGRSYVLAMVNQTAWWHPMHLHGHAFRSSAAMARPPAIANGRTPC